MCNTGVSSAAIVLVLFIGIIPPKKEDIEYS